MTEQTETVSPWNAGVAPSAQPGSPEPAQNCPQIDFADLVTRIQKGDQTAMDSLYRIFSKGLRYLFVRQLGRQDFEDRLHETFVITISAIQTGSLRDPDRVMGFLRTVAHRQIAAHIEQQVHTRTKETDIDLGAAIADRKQNLERQAEISEQTEIARKVLAKLNPKQREVLTRFYLWEQRPEQICREMKLTETQFRLLKSRAKTLFGALGQKELKKPASTPLNTGAGGRDLAAAECA